MKLPYKEVVVSELRNEEKEFYRKFNPFSSLLPSVESAANATYGVTLEDENGNKLRLRVYPTVESRNPFCLILDALKGADIPKDRIEAALSSSIFNFSEEEKKAIAKEVYAQEPLP